MSCIFCKIINHELDAQIVYEDELTLAFRDIAPAAPHHLLVIPKTHISTINEADNTHQALLGHMLLVAKRLAQEEKIHENGYRLVMNCNNQGGQTVFHIHLHLLGGRNMHWPPG
ncbi:histidine triad nucleotide-binding protein [Zooshikella harenae]|uniref:Histidine triad nucleotide-binding protein n=1 Tax=Zooshikella harenae TaxID=2827238 RepID=A0ABS5Z9U3_9GAMM|nr:histidine triad nucleotide-binding protein [Zooshikella harenae]MBU2710523.1 histidine triad nucleotide-binding protein [Zooshikella harenae]